MKKLKGEVEELLELAGAVIADKGFQGSGYVTPAKKPKDREPVTSSVSTGVPSHHPLF